MSYVNEGQSNKSAEDNATKDFDLTVNEICEKALSDAKAQLHPLLRSVEPDRLKKRNEFIQAFRSALERRIAKKLAMLGPGVQAVYRFDETRRRPGSPWNGSIHLLVKVPRLSNMMKSLSRKLDQSLLKSLRSLGWSRFQKLQTILEIQQVTPQEIRRGISYGAMFYAVYTVPAKVWPQDERHGENAWR